MCAGLLTLWAGAVSAACSTDTVTVKHEGALKARFSVAIADTPETRNRGLMFVEEMPTGAGMLFIYDEPGFASFWMRNTLIPLDMLFIGDDGTITKIHENAVPLDETAIFGGNEVRFVLEINGGLSARLGLEEGAVIQHPTINQEIAVFPCE